MNLKSTIVYELFKNEIETHLYYCEQLEGAVNIDNLCISLAYAGDNVLTNLSEGYVITFIKETPDVEIETVINNNIDSFKLFFDNQKIDLTYLKVYCDNQDTLSLLEKKDKKGLFDLKLLSVSIIKDLQNRHNVYYKNPNTYRLLTHSDIDFINDVTKCLQDAHLNGIPSDLRANIDYEKFKENVLINYTPLITKNRFTLILEEDSDFLGHATYELIENDTGKKQANLIDIYILSDNLKKGHSKLLSLQGEFLCKKFGAETLRGSIEIEDPNMRRKLLNSTRQTGWNYEALTYIKIH